MGFCAVVLAGTSGSRLFPLSEGIPKALLPVGNRPMISFILDSLRRAGANEAVVATTPRFEPAVRAAIARDVEEGRVEWTESPVAASSKPRLRVSIAVVNEMYGSGEALRELCRDERLRARRELLVLSGETLASAGALLQLAQAHRARGCDVTLLAHERFDVADGAAAAGGKPAKKPKVDSADVELMMMTLDGRVAQKVSLLELDDDDDPDGAEGGSLLIDKALLRRAPRLVVRADLVDAHAYFFDGPALRAGFFGGASEAGCLAHASALRADVVPLLAHRYFKLTLQPPGAPDPADEDPYSVYTALMAPGGDGEFGAEEQKVAASPEARADTPPMPSLGGKPLCANGATAVIVSNQEPADAGDDDGEDALGGRDFAVRVRAVQAYVAMCRHVVARAASGRAPPGSVDGKLMKRDGSLVGSGSEIGDKVQLKHTTVGRGCTIGARCKINNSVIFDGVTIGDGCVIQNSIVCAGASVQDKCNLNDCQVGADTVVPANTVARQEVFVANEADQ